MLPCARRSPVWSNGKVLDLISVYGEEAVQPQLRSSYRNYDTLGEISRDMMERGHNWDALQCRIKVKELRNAYRKAHEANNYSGGAPATCRFYKELDAIFGGDLTSIPRTTMDTSEPSQCNKAGQGGAKWERGWYGSRAIDQNAAHTDQHVTSGSEVIP
ncbi:Zinc finger and SCAN domain-containing protein 29 [Chelonia mydas]|uniref:Zinc finger and SCAN domain-containing protein 29 n=1 Tax=Chelonia mydas TaxID=8469 RepID=M7AVL8_CHEMY|nr:Zinc finger and SCAN domain-containing protein 29 [Chelonia mydas]